MKRENLAVLIAILSFLFYIAQNIYFGWNKEPQSVLEGFCDWLSIFGYFIAFLIKPISNTTHYEIHHAENLQFIDKKVNKKARQKYEK